MDEKILLPKHEDLEHLSKHILTDAFETSFDLRTSETAREFTRVFYIVFYNEYYGNGQRELKGRVVADDYGLYRGFDELKLPNDKFELFLPIKIIYKNNMFNKKRKLREEVSQENKIKALLKEYGIDFSVEVNDSIVDIKYTRKDGVHVI